MRDQINDALKLAMKARDSLKTSTLRLVNAAIKDRDIAARGNGGRDLVGDEEILEILSKMVKQRRESFSIYKEAGRLDLSDQEAKEIDIITEFLPKQMSDEEIKAACEATIAKINAEGLKDMGKIMGALKAKYTGQMDFGKASKMIRDIL
ncbi:MAG: GatB/YqeY domain-containing protein [Rhizobiales bacterium]|nr:GatB/YqeY domain-containing protein [Hyphomicrobiales bacterium]NRB14041.1 GatB/YqeY domain-containing protein [Hyphomicrobiales bacterium]